MRESLKNVRARVDRLASQLLLDGCPVCREDEARIRIWNDIEDDPSLDAADRLAAASQTCTACRRTYARRHLVIIHEQPEAHG